MKKKDNIFDLVKSLDKNEKRFFKFYVSLHNKNKLPQYVHLYEILNKAKLYDNGQIVAQFSKKFPRGNVNKVKQKLKHNIFNALILYHKTGTRKISENEHINISQILIAKKLYSTAEKILLKLRENAIAQENFQLHIQVNTELINININKNYQGQNKIKLIEQYFQENLLCTKKMSEKIQLLLITTKVSSFYHSKKRITKQFKNFLLNILEQDLRLFGSNELLSNRAKLQYNNLIYTINRLTDRNEDALKAIEKVRQLVKKPVFQFYPTYIAIAYLNVLQSYIANKIVEPFYTVLKEAQAFFNKHPEEKVRYQHAIYLRELEFHSNVIKKDAGIDLFNKIMTYIENNQNRLPLSYKNMLLAGLARCSFLAQNYKTSQDVFLKITLESSIVSDDYSFIEIYLMEILISYELGFSNIANQKWEILRRKIRKPEIDGTEVLLLIDKIGVIIKSKKVVKRNFIQLNNFLQTHHTVMVFQHDLYFLSVWVKQKIALLKL